MFWSSPFASNTITSMISAVSVPPDDEGEEHGERARHEGADEGDVGRDERDDGDRPPERDVERRCAPIPTTTALNAATIETPMK